MQLNLHSMLPDFQIPPGSPTGRTMISIRPGRAAPILPGSREAMPEQAIRHEWISRLAVSTVCERGKGDSAFPPGRVAAMIRIIPWVVSYGRIPAMEQER